MDEVKIRFCEEKRGNIDFVAACLSPWKPSKWEMGLPVGLHWVSYLILWISPLWVKIPVKRAVGVTGIGCQIQTPYQTPGYRMGSVDIWEL